MGSSTEMKAVAVGVEVGGRIWMGGERFNYLVGSNQLPPADILLSSRIR